MLSILDFPTVSHLKSMVYLYIMALRVANTNHANTNMAICILKHVSIAMRSKIQMKLYRAAII